MADYNWTAPLHDIEAEARVADALELAGVSDLDGEAMERINDAEHADFFSVYFHLIAGGASCIADRPTYEEARTFAEELSRKFDFPLNDYT